MTTKTKMLSTDSDSSSRYAAKYSVAALLPCVAATHSPSASPSPTHTMTHAMFRDERAPASVLGWRAGCGIVEVGRDELRAAAQLDLLKNRITRSRTESRVQRRAPGTGAASRDWSRGR